jgi:hypothetical protein
VDAADRQLGILRRAGSGCGDGCRVEERALTGGAGEGLDLAVAGQMECRLDTVARLEALEEGRPKRHAELDRAEMTPLIEDRNHTARAQTGHAGLQTAMRRATGVGVDDRMPEAGEIIAVFLDLVQPQEGGRRRGMELELDGAIVLAQHLIGREELLAQPVAITGGETLPDLGDVGDQGAHGLGHPGLGLDVEPDAFGVLTQLGALRFQGQAVQGAQIEKGQHRDGEQDRSPGADHVVDPETEVGEHQSLSCRPRLARTLKPRFPSAGC